MRGMRLNVPLLRGYRLRLLEEGAPRAQHQLGLSHPRREHLNPTTRKEHPVRNTSWG
jgi:hypothetical protein